IRRSRDWTDGQGATLPHACAARTHRPPFLDGTPPAAAQMTRTDPLATVEAALAEVRSGRPVVPWDDERQDRPAHLVLAAELASADAISLLGMMAGGPTRLALPERRCDALGLESLTSGGGSSLRPGSTVSIDARGLSTGISAADRARTVAVAIDPAS